MVNIHFLNVWERAFFRNNNNRKTNIDNNVAVFCQISTGYFKTVHILNALVLFLN